MWDHLDVLDGGVRRRGVVGVAVDGVLEGSAVDGIGEGDVLTVVGGAGYCWAEGAEEGRVEGGGVGECGIGSFGWGGV